MKKINLFFLYCSGVCIPLLHKSLSEHNKYIGMGATVFFTGLFASIAATYAFLYISDKLPLACLIGLVWGLMIFNLDRLIVGSTKKTAALKKDSLILIPRVIMAIFISIIIATPIELKIFEKEIEQELIRINQANKEVQEKRIGQVIDSLETSYKTYMKNLEEEVKLKEVLRDAMARTAQEEADGTGGSGQRNLGPIYALKKVNADRAQTEYIALKRKNKSLIDKTYNSIDSLSLYQLSLIDSIQPLTADGLASRMVALNKLAAREHTIYMIKLFITLLFLLIELSPIIIKLMMDRGPYDHLLANYEKRIISRDKSRA